MLNASKHQPLTKGKHKYFVIMKAATNTNTLLIDYYEILTTNIFSQHCPIQIIRSEKNSSCALEINIAPKKV